MFRPLFILLFKLYGWKIDGQIPPIRKYICAVAPHTSNWDFVVGVAARSILRITRAKYLGKSQLFKAPYGWFFRLTGGIPVYRDKSHDMVDQVVGVANASDDFILAIAPEGTRTKVDKLKTGFWYISKEANIPVIPVGFDYERRLIVIGLPIYPTDIESDMNSLMTFYQGIKGRNPELGF
jgi:1-acyl-sn-glycerol-3-phosphate acyltransferase